MALLAEGRGWEREKREGRREGEKEGRREEEREGERKGGREEVDSLFSVNKFDNGCSLNA